MAAEILAQVILGHHAGLPDSQGENGSLSLRLERYADSVPEPIRAAARHGLASRVSMRRAGGTGHVRAGDKQAFWGDFLQI